MECYSREGDNSSHTETEGHMVAALLTRRQHNAPFVCFFAQPIDAENSAINCAARKLHVALNFDVMEGNSFRITNPAAFRCCRQPMERKRRLGISKV